MNTGFNVCVKSESLIFGSHVPPRMEVSFVVVVVECEPYLLIYDIILKLKTTPKCITVSCFLNIIHQ